MNVQFPLEAQSVCGVRQRAQTPSQGLQLLSLTSFLRVYILTRTEYQCFRVIVVWGFCLFGDFLRRCGCGVSGNAGNRSISQLHLFSAGHDLGELAGTVQGWLASEREKSEGEQTDKGPFERARAACHSEGTGSGAGETLGTRHSH